MLQALQLSVMLSLGVNGPLSNELSVCYVKFSAQNQSLTTNQSN